MQITHERLNEEEAVITLNIEAKDYEGAVKDALKQYQKEAHFKGFRPGKVPRSVVEKRYGARLRIEKIDALVKDRMREYLEEHAAEFLGTPTLMPQAQPLAWNNDTAFELKYTISIRPAFDYVISRDIKATLYKVDTVSTADLDEVLLQYQKEYATFSKTEKASTVADTLSLRIDCPARNYHAHSHIALADLPKDFRKHFIDLSNNATVTLDFKEVVQSGKILLSNFEKEEYAALEREGGALVFTIQDVLHIVPAPVDQNLFDKVLGKAIVEKDHVHTEEAFRNQVKAQLLAWCSTTARQMLTQQIKNTLVEKTSIAIPQALLKQWHAAYEAYQGQHQTTQEQAKEDYINTVKWKLITEKIAQKHAIVVTSEDTVTILQERFALTQEEIATWLSSTNNQQALDVLEYTKAAALTNKVIEAIQSQITVEEKSVSYEELKTIKSTR